MINWYCKKCPIIKSDCGPWDDNGEYFKNILFVHRNHTGFQQGEPSDITKEATQIFNQNIDKWFHNLASYYKPGKSCLIKNKWSDTT